MTERWAPVPEAKGMYEVSDRGRVRSLKTPPQGRILRTQPSTAQGHQRLDLMIDGQRCPRWVHRLVMAAFVGPCPPGHVVRHLDGDATNNALTNLTYGTPSQNERDKVRHGTHNMASKTHCAQGHEYTPENTIVTPRQRRCRACINTAARRRYRRKLEDAATEASA